MPPTEFVIRQLEGPAPGVEPKVLRLNDKASPLQGFDRVAVRQRGRVRRPPGSRTGTAFLQGAEDEPTEYGFLWSPQTLIGANAQVNGRAFNDADRLLDVVEEMVSQPVLVTVEWAGRSPVGWLASVRAPVSRPGRYEVEIEVEWVKPDERKTDVVPQPPNVEQRLKELQRDWVEAIRVIQRPAHVAQEALSEAADAVNEVGRHLSMAGAAWIAYRDAVIDLDGFSGSVASSCAGVVEQGAAVREAVDHPTSTFCATDDPAARIGALRMRAAIAHAGNVGRRRGQLTRLRALQLGRDDILGVHIGREGEDLRLLAWDYYGDVELWQDIARFNELQRSTLTAGQRVLLPALRQAA